MKNTIKLVAVVMIIAMLSLTLVSCSNTLSGKYSAEVNLGFTELKVTYEFGIFGKVTRTSVNDAIIGSTETEVLEGKYEIFEDPDDPKKLKIAFEFEGQDREEYSFSKVTENGVDYIKIGGISYELVK